jgi:hypothetical protein
MRRFKIRMPSAGVILGFLALAVSLGGTAAANLPGTNVVISSDIANGHVRAPDIQTDAVRTAEIQAGAVQDTDLGTIVEHDGNNIVVTDAANDGDWSTGSGVGGSNSTAVCPAGEKLIGGTMEWDTDGGVNGDLAIVKMFPSFGTNSWIAVGSNDEGTSETFHAVAFCLQ